MSVDAQDRPPFDMADEDFAILNAIAENLEQHGLYEIMLKGGSRLTNTGPETAIRFAGIDQIKDAKDKLVILGAPGRYELVMATKKYTQRTKVGELFDMPLIADPNCPSDRFLIKPVEIPGNKT